MKKEGLSKSERIVSQKLINELFTGGQSQSLTAFPIRIVYEQLSTLNSQTSILKPQLSILNSQTSTLNSQLSTLKSQISILISVPKRRFKHAVDRNRVKRQLREAYRKNKQLLISELPEGQSVALAFIWLSDQHLPSSIVEQRVTGLLQRIAKKIHS